MTATARQRSARFPARGISLVEALVAMAVMAFGMLALVGVQANLRRAADLGRHTTEASRMAGDDLEAVRQIDGVAPGPAVAAAWADIASATAITSAAVAGTTTAFSLDRQVLALMGLPVPSEWAATSPANVEASRLKLVDTVVRWNDRRGQANAASLATLISAQSPTMRALLLADVRAGAHTLAGGMSPRLPSHTVQTIDLGNGRVAIEPLRRHQLIIEVDKVSGEVKRRCTAWAQGNVPSQCVVQNGLGYMISGSISFDNSIGAPATFMTPARQAASSVPLTAPNWACDEVQTQIGYHFCPTGSDRPFDPVAPLVLTSSRNVAATDCFVGPVHPSIAGYNDAAFYRRSVYDATQVEYVCIVTLASNNPAWSGRLELRAGPGWSITGVPLPAVGASAGAEDRRVCRFSPNVAGGTTRNDEHPDTYMGVRGALARQNFLVVPSATRCPIDIPVDYARGHLVDRTTWPHQPGGPMLHPW